MPRTFETLPVDYDAGGRPRKEALQSLKDLGDTAIDKLQPQVLPGNNATVRLRAIAILANLQDCSAESAETLALVMKTVGDWDFEERTLPEICATLEAASGVSFRLSDSLDPRMKLSIRFREGKLNTLLHLMLRPRGMKFIIRGKEVWIS